MAQDVLYMAAFLIGIAIFIMGPFIVMAEERKVPAGLWALGGVAICLLLLGVWVEVAS